jgi:hypothetical protein
VGGLKGWKKCSKIKVKFLLQKKKKKIKKSVCFGVNRCRMDTIPGQWTCLHVRVCVVETE